MNPRSVQHQLLNFFQNLVRQFPAKGNQLNWWVSALKIYFVHFLQDNVN